MKTIMSNRRRLGVLILAAVICCPFTSCLWAADSTIPEAQTLATAASIVHRSGAPGGICAVVAPRDAGLPLAMAKQGSFVVHALGTEPALCDRLRQQIRSQGVYGVVSVDKLQAGRLPYADNLVNLIVVDSYPELPKERFFLAEAARTLVPLGTICIGTSSAADHSEAWTKALTAQLSALGLADVMTETTGGCWVCARKPWPADIDEWTHYLHAADGNPVARDSVVAPPKHYQWVSDPVWQRSHETTSSVSTLVTARGRLFAIVDEAPISLAGQHSLPDKWCLTARDAFNGVLLWKVPIRRWGWREWKNTWFSNRPGDFPFNLQKRLLATGERVYVTLGYQAPVSQLDARTGEILQTYADTERTGEILDAGGTLVLSVLVDDGVKVMAIDADSGKRRWATQKSYLGSTVDYVKWTSRYAKLQPPKLDPTLNIATDGKTIAFIDGSEIVGLDFATGAERWRAPFPLEDADRGAGGISAQDKLWIGTMIVCDGVVLHASPNKLAAFSADTGELLWAQLKKYIGHLWYEWKDVFVIDGLVWTWSPELGEGFFDIGRTRKQRTLWPRTVNGYDLKTGELKKSVPLGTIFNAHHHHRCYRNKATTRYILASRRGTEYVDLKEGKHTVHNWVRGTCHVGMMPANGLQYAPPHPCACYIDEKLSGMTALAPRVLADHQQPAASRQSLQRGPAYDQLSGSLAPSSAASAEDWPAFRHDAMRTGSVTTRVPDNATLQWHVRVGRRISPPIAAANRIFTALIDEHHVVCLDARDGSKQWEFAAGGRIDSPPTYYQGTVLFGSRDGRVYCVRASDGQLVWRFLAAPAERLIGAFGQLESAWPVNGSVLVLDGKVYFVAGRSSQLDGGLFLYGLDAATGKLLYQRTMQGPDYKVGDFEENFKLPMGSLPDILMGDDSGIYMRSNAFDAELNPKRGAPALSSKSGFLEGSYFKRVPWSFGKGDYARLIVHDKQSAYFVRMFDTLRGLDPTVYFTPGSKGYLLFAKYVGSNRNAWTQRIPVRVRAMVLASGRLFVAGPPDVIDPKDPLGAFESRKGGILCVVDSASGEKHGEHRLPAPPVFNGAAAASGRLFLAGEDGSIVCYASP